MLTDYLRGFTTAVRGRSKAAIYLDLFAGSFENDRRYGTGTSPGSSQIALKSQPQFTRLIFFELPAVADHLRNDIERALPADCRWEIQGGNSNTTLQSVLAGLADVRTGCRFDNMLAGLAGLRASKQRTPPKQGRGTQRL